MSKKFTYIKYTIPNKTKFILTSRPDSYDDEVVNEFILEHKPCVRFQLTDDPMKKERAGDIPFHWLSWFPARSIPLEIAYFNVSLLNHYASKCENDAITRTIWMHCDSSSMRAPTFLGLYLFCYWLKDIDSIISEATCTCDYRRKSCPKHYAETSMELDSGIKEMVNYWQSGGEDMAHNFISNRRSI